MTPNDTVSLTKTQFLARFYILRSPTRYHHFFILISPFPTHPSSTFLLPSPIHSLFSFFFLAFLYSSL
ncbi:hypothetical protein Pint_12152 [Pistacia integerrima]|uniref:Uncharacterized protein n=1 Tax=Pistacia integerrima TaxID=434235 RepID=A0ACC0XJI3_9ROSI|nr:hypothetical protein Pint_12152 [Pistacia integerrima]